MRTWICCFGIGEWGCCGAAYFLANNWENIQKSVGTKQFAYITRTEGGKDDSTCIVSGPFFSQNDVEKFARNKNRNVNN